VAVPTHTPAFQKEYEGSEGTAVAAQLARECLEELVDVCVRRKVCGKVGTDDVWRVGYYCPVFGESVHSCEGGSVDPAEG